MKRLRNIMLCMLIIVTTVIICGCVVYKYNTGAVSKNTDSITVVIPSGTSTKNIAKLLKENNVIRDENFFLIYLKLFKISNIKAGTYDLNQSMDVKQIVSVLEAGNNFSNEEITILFKEGINMRRIASTIADNTNNDENSVYDLLNDTEYLDSIIDEYWFLTDDIKNNDIYYSLEGYLFPDTYKFSSKEVSVKAIFKKMLDQMNNVLTKYKTDFDNSEYSIHELLTLASIVDLEGSISSDKASIAGVFYNRLATRMSLGSDVTSYYGVKVDLSERDLTKAEYNDVNPYNTRVPSMSGKLPVGPICIPSEDALKAVLEPDNNDYYYFVSDKNGKTYFSKNDSEQQQVIKELKEKGDWFEW